MQLEDRARSEIIANLGLLIPVGPEDSWRSVLERVGVEIPEDGAFFYALAEEPDPDQTVLCLTHSGVEVKMTAVGKRLFWNKGLDLFRDWPLEVIYAVRDVKIYDNVIFGPWTINSSGTGGAVPTFTGITGYGGGGPVSAPYIITNSEQFTHLFGGAAGATGAGNNGAAGGVSAAGAGGGGNGYGGGGGGGGTGLTGSSNIQITGVQAHFSKGDKVQFTIQGHL